MSETSNFTDNNLHPEILCDCLSRCDGIGSMHGFHDVDCPRHPKNISAAPPAPSEQQERLKQITEFVRLATSERTNLSYWEKCEGNENLRKNSYEYCCWLLSRFVRGAALAEDMIETGGESFSAMAERDCGRRFLAALLGDDAK